MQRINYSSGAPLEEQTGYSRMVKLGNQIYIAGTTAVQPDGEVFGITAYEQAKYILVKSMAMLQRAGAEAKDVYKVKIYAIDMGSTKEIVAAYSEIFKEVRPVLTVVGTSQLNRPTQLVEIELEAMLGCEVQVEK